MTLVLQALGVCLLWSTVVGAELASSMPALELNDDMDYECLLSNMNPDVPPMAVEIGKGSEILRMASMNEDTQSSKALTALRQYYETHAGSTEEFQFGSATTTERVVDIRFEYIIITSLVSDGNSMQKE